MEFTSQQKKFINAFVAEIDNGDAAVFAGAGLSAGKGFVNWKGLLKDLAEEVGLDVEKENDLVSVAQYHVNRFKRGKINNKIVNDFTSLTDGTENHNILARIGIETFWTTNYDQLIERTLEKNGKTVEKKIRNADFSRNIKRKNATLYKMHGDKDSPEEAVLTKDDYESYNDLKELFSIALRGDLVSKTFLFVGFSFDDPNLEYILGRIKVLLKENTPTHYCFFKEVSEDDFKDKKKSSDQNREDFLYAKIKQSLKIEDLVRYGIHAVMIKDYGDITCILYEIEKRIKRKNIFISGAAHTYDPYSEEDARELVHALSYNLAEGGYRIVSGFGWGIGSYVINGALDYKLNSNYRSLDDLLMLRPFPQMKSGQKDEAKVFTEYRLDMLSNAGIAIFLFGNKLNGESVEKSGGMLEEFKICIEKGIVPIPVGATGYVAKQLWEELSPEFEKHYPGSADLVKAITEIGRDGISNNDLIKQILIAISILQKA